MPNIARFALYTVLLASGIAHAQTPPTTLGVAERPTIAVTGEAEVLVDPDYATLRISVRHFGLSVVDVRMRNQATVAQLLRDARSVGVAEGDLASTPTMVFPGRWLCGSCTEAEGRTGQTAYTDVTLTLRKMEAVSEFAAQLSGNENILLLDVEYRTTKLREHRDHARAMAIRAAREKATALTREIDQSIGPALSINETASEGGYWSWSQWGYSCCGAYSRYGRYNSNQSMMQNVSIAAGDTSPPGEGALAPGRIPVRARVAVSFELR